MNIAFATRECGQMEQECRAQATAIVEETMTSYAMTNCCWNLVYCDLLLRSEWNITCNQTCTPFCPDRVPQLEECLEKGENDLLSLYANFIIGGMMIIVYILVVVTSFSKETLDRFKCCDDKKEARNERDGLLSKMMSARTSKTSIKIDQYKSNASMKKIRKITNI